jgi:hypothetical protein
MLSTTKVGCTRASFLAAACRRFGGSLTWEIVRDDGSLTVLFYAEGSVPEGSPKRLHVATWEGESKLSATGQGWVEPRYDRNGQRLTDCCGVYSTYSDETLCCKKCWHTVEIGQGDGSEYREGAEAR